MISTDQLSSEKVCCKTKDDQMANQMKTRASATSDRTDAFFSCFEVNRFFYDAVKTTTNKSLRQVAGQLLLPEQQIRKYLLSNYLPVVLKYLRAGCNAIDSRLGPAPAVYRAYWDSIRHDYLFDDDALELLRPISRHHFDYTALMMTRFSSMTAERMKLFTSEWVDRVPFDNNWSNHYFFTPCARSFREKLREYYRQIPDVIRGLSMDQLFKANSDMSVAFLHGSVSFPTPGIASPHLKGRFLLGLRNANTGYLSLNCDCHAATTIGVQTWRELIDWYRENNQLYSELTPITCDNVDIRLASLCTATVVAAEVPGAHTCLTNEQGQVCLRIRNSDGHVSQRYLSLEAALALAFPLLFPYGVPEVPAKTLRKKARLILAAHPWYRCGRLHCHMILFLYHVIQDHTLAFQRKRLSFQPIQVPEGTNRDIRDPPIYTDPGSSAYWAARQSEVRSMCHHYGDPDIMLTLTFVNKWPEVSDVERASREILGDTCDIRFCPVESMCIWKDRFYDLKDGDFGSLITLLGFPPLKHYTWRLEFQTRGAPHVHALLWLSQPLSLGSITRNLFACTPDAIRCPMLHTLVTTTMSHGCTVQRCKRGDANRPCRYGFPKPPCSAIHVDDSGCLHLPRAWDN